MCHSRRDLKARCGTPLFSLYEDVPLATTLALLTAAADVVERYSSEQYASTQDTMDKYNEIFV